MLIFNQRNNLTHFFMNNSLDIQNNPNETFENDFAIINLNTEEITWKAGMFTPKMQNNIMYHLKLRNK